VDSQVKNDGYGILAEAWNVSFTMLNPVLVDGWQQLEGLVVIIPPTPE